MRDPKPWTKTIYEKTMAEMKKSKGGKILAKAKELKWVAHDHAEHTGTKNLFLVAPFLGYDSEVTMFLEDIPPGRHNNKHGTSSAL